MFLRKCDTLLSKEPIFEGIRFIEVKTILFIYYTIITVLVKKKIKFFQTCSRAIFF